MGIILWMSFSGGGFLFGVLVLLTTKKIVIDKKIRKVIIETKWNTGQLISEKIICFSDIKEIVTTHVLEDTQSL